MKEVKIIQIWFENCTCVEVGIEEFEWIHIDNVCSCYQKINEFDCLREALHAIGEVSFRLKPKVKNWRYIDISGEAVPLPEGMTVHEGIISRLQEYMDITEIILCYDDESEKSILVPYDSKWSCGEESWLQSTELDESGRLTVKILPERPKDDESVSS